jgi:predicted AAA+ superfamily ATPase
MRRAFFPPSPRSSLSPLSDLVNDVLREEVGFRTAGISRTALIENFVAQHLSVRKPLAYWKRENNLAEIDFLLDRDGIVPVEIKATKNSHVKF